MLPERPPIPRAIHIALDQGLSTGGHWMLIRSINVQRLFTIINHL